MGSILSVLAPVFLCAAAGWVWSRAGRPFDRNAAGTLNSDLAAPCLVYSRLVGLEMDPAAMATMTSAAVLSFVAVAVAGWALLRLARLPRHTYLSPIVFNNAGNIGIPVCLFAFGEQALPLAIAYFAVCAVLNFVVGPVLWSGRFDPLALLRTPLVWAVAAAVATLGLDLAVPGWLLATTHLLGDLAIPLMLLSLGVSLAELRITRLGRASAIAGLRLGLGLASGLVCAALFGLEGDARGVLVVQAAMPAAVFNHVFAQRYGRAPEEIASIVLLSTLLGFVTLPLILRMVGVAP